jgi:hypothetical protein
VIDVQQEGLQYTLGAILFHGVLENKILYPDLVQMLNIKLWLMLLQK